ncbi:MAG TPA: YceH family protein [Solirubrobacteraceae bacterium]|nr:YceH family protein [Solirubrobacteraceae bacterium]
MDLSAAETRVLGCLLEKQKTTPDTYPLSLNALRLACNQSTARDPVVDYDEAVIRDALHRLERRGYVRLASGAGSRAAKYRHLLAEALPMGDDEQAAMCVLMLRGAQTPGELKQRSERMHAFADLAAVAATLARLIERGLIERQERRPGHKEERYAQLLEGGERGADAAARAGPPAAGTLAAGLAREPQRSNGDAPGGEGLRAGGEDLRARVERLEREVAALRAAAGLPAIG